jgi:hypothetical protein
MTITSTGPDGIRVNSAAKNGTLGSQAAAASNEIIFDTAITTNNGNLEASPTFVGRLVIVRLGASDEETRYMTAIDGDTVTATVNEDWVVPPVENDTYHVAYILQDAATLTGIGLDAKTGLYVFSRTFSIGTAGGGGAFAYFSMTNYIGMESDDNGSSDDITVEDNGRWDIGYIQAGAPLAAGVVTNVKNTDGEPYIQLNGGAMLRWNAAILWSQAADTTFTMTADSTNDIIIRGATFIKTSYTAIFKECTLNDVIWQGLGQAADTISVTSGTNIDIFQLANTAGFTTPDDSVTETLEVRNCTFVGNSVNVTIHNDKTWNFVNPIGWEVNSTAIAFQVDDNNEVNKLGSLEVNTQESDGTVISGARVYVWDELTDDLIHELDTDTSGDSSADVLLEKYTYPSSVFTTVTGGPFALKVFKHTFSPTVGAIDPTGGLDLPLTLVPDSNISETSATQAISDGAGITYTNNTNPTSTIEFTGGAGTLSVSEVVSGQTSLASGTLVQYEEGDSSAGTVYLNTRNGNDFSDGETLSDGGDWTATYTASTQQDFTWEINSSGTSMQVLYDYQSAKLEEDTLDAIFEEVVEWGQSSEGFMHIADGGDAWRTRRVNSEGVFVSDRGTGTITLFTADDGTTFTPPQSFTFTLTNIQPDSEVRLYNLSDGAEREGDESVTGSIQTTITIDDAGSGYNVGNLLTVQGGTYTVQGVLEVDSVGGSGEITAVSVSTAGSYTVAPSNPVNVTGGDGTGAKFTLTIRGTFSHTYTYAGSDIGASLVVFHLDFKAFKTDSVILSNTDQSFTVFQIADRVYDNPT